jgi:hypothetical protein
MTTNETKPPAGDLERAARDALFMALRVMSRNLERAREMKDAYDIDALNAMILETEAWLRDYGQPPAPPERD